MRKFRTLTVFLMAFLLWNIPNLAFAVYRDDGDEPGEPLAGATLVLVFVGIPVLFGLVISILVLAPNWFRKNAREFSNLAPKDPLFIEEDSKRKAISS